MPTTFSYINYTIPPEWELILDPPKTKTQFSLGEFVIQYNKQQNAIFIGLVRSYYDQSKASSVGFEYCLLEKKWQTYRRPTNETTLSLNKLITQCDVDNIDITKVKPKDIILVKSRTMWLGQVEENSRIKRITNNGYRSQLFQPKMQYVKINDILDNVL